MDDIAKGVATPAPTAMDKTHGQQPLQFRSSSSTTNPDQLWSSTLTPYPQPLKLQEIPSSEFDDDDHLLQTIFTMAEVDTTSQPTASFSLKREGTPENPEERPTKKPAPATSSALSLASYKSEVSQHICMLEALLAERDDANQRAAQAENQCGIQEARIKELEHDLTLARADCVQTQSEAQRAKVRGMDLKMQLRQVEEHLESVRTVVQDRDLELELLRADHREAKLRRQQDKAAEVARLMNQLREFVAQNPDGKQEGTGVQDG